MINITISHVRKVLAGVCKILADSTEIRQRHVKVCQLLTIQLDNFVYLVKCCKKNSYNKCPEHMMIILCVLQFHQNAVRSSAKISAFRYILQNPANVALTFAKSCGHLQNSQYNLYCPSSRLQPAAATKKNPPTSGRERTRAGELDEN